MSVLGALLSCLVIGLLWIIKFAFLGGWFITRLVLWAMSPFFALLAVLGGLTGYLTQ
jgi:hypothetical protein